MIDLVRHHFGPLGAAAFHATHPPADSGQSSSAAGHGDRADLTHEPSQMAAWAEFHESAGNLPAEMGEVFDLIFYQGLSHAEAAGLLGVSTKTVQRRWQDGCVRLHKALGGRLPGI
jgi:RNA polymerase sigma-70 factor (ECF subfamily)